MTEGNPVDNQRKSFRAIEDCVIPIKTILEQLFNIKCNTMPEPRVIKSMLPKSRVSAKNVSRETFSGPATVSTDVP